MLTSPLTSLSPLDHVATPTHIYMAFHVLPSLCHRRYLTSLIAQCCNDAAFHHDRSSLSCALRSLIRYALIRNSRKACLLSPAFFFSTNAKLDCSRVADTTRSSSHSHLPSITKGSPFVMPPPRDSRRIIRFTLRTFRVGWWVLQGFLCRRRYSHYFPRLRDSDRYVSFQSLLIHTHTQFRIHEKRRETRGVRGKTPRK